jgi:hypothetical protein
MNCCKLLLVFIFISNTCTAQSDFILLKKGSRVLETWFSGQNIQLQLDNRQWVNAVINKIQDDSLYLRPFVTQVLANRWGMPYIDTTYYGVMNIDVKDIRALPKTGESFPYIRNGLIFQIGGGGYLALNVINTLSNNEPVFGDDNISKVSIAAAVLAAGTLMSLTHKSIYVLGKKYHIEYISSKPS